MSQLICPKNLPAGYAFGYSTVIAIDEISEDRSVGAFYLCRCQCGKVFRLTAFQIIRLQQKTCGCKKRGRVDKHHGLKGTPEYKVWSSILERCRNKKHKRYSSYGGRGIDMCQEWADSFISFLQAMGHRPSDKHSIDRIDNDRGYEPGNCRWATSSEQNRNRRRCMFLTLNGQTKHVNEWCETVGINKSTLLNRLRRGWSHEKTLTTPVRSEYSNSASKITQHQQVQSSL